MAQHLREGSVVSVVDNASTPTTYSGVTVTNLTQAYIEFDGGGYGEVVLPWTSIAKLSVTTD